MKRVAPFSLNSASTVILTSNFGPTRSNSTRSNFFFTLSALGCLLGILFSGNAKAKDRIDWLAKAKEIKLQFPDDNVALVSHKEIYTFSIETVGGESVVQAKKVVHAEYIALKDFEHSFFGEGYDSFSEVTQIRAEEVPYISSSPKLQVNDREYDQKELFDHDSRVKFLILPLKTMGHRYLAELVKEIKDIRYLNVSHFMGKIPCMEKTIEIIVPPTIDLDFREFHFSGEYEIQKQVTTDNKKNTVTTFTMKNVAGIPTEKYSPEYSKIYPHIVFIAKGFTDKAGKKIPIMGNTAEQYGWYKSLVNKIENNESGLKEVVDRLLVGKNGEEEKIKSLFYWVQDNIKYIAFERGIAGFQPEAASKVYTNKFGDCKGMANLLRTMLKLAGFDARLAWIGTNDRPYDYSLPSMIVDNHMICALRWKNQFYFLDGTEKYIGLGDYAQRIQGREVLIENGAQYIIEKVPTLSLDRNRYEEKKWIQFNSDKLVGKAQAIYHGESQTDFLRGIQSVSKDKKSDALFRFLTEGDKNMEVSQIAPVNTEEREKPIELNYEVQYQNKITKVGNELYVSIDYSRDLENLVPKKDRKSPIEITENIYRIYTTQVEIPAQATVKRLPPAIHIKKPKYEFTVAYQQKNNQIVMEKTIKLNAQIIGKKDLADWNEDIKKLKEMNEEQIILSM